MHKVSKIYASNAYIDFHEVNNYSYNINEPDLSPSTQMHPLVPSISQSQSFPDRTAIWNGRKEIRRRTDVIFISKIHATFEKSERRGDVRALGIFRIELAVII